jgi:hypothetical protein
VAHLHGFNPELLSALEVLTAASNLTAKALRLTPMATGVPT